MIISLDAEKNPLIKHNILSCLQFQKEQEFKELTIS